MDALTYLSLFQKTVDRIDKKLLAQKHIEVAVGEVLDSVFLKLYKNSWANAAEDPLTAESRIFFSIWVNGATLRQKKIFYNIHALKLRKLNGYAIESRKFASSFRAGFTLFEPQWPNVSVHYGPLTLMEGWIPFDEENMEGDVLGLVGNFLEMEGLVDEVLGRFVR